MGGLIALEVAAQQPDLTLILGLIGVSVPMTVSTDLLTKTQNDIPAAVSLIVSWAFGQRAHIGGTQTPGLWMLGGGRQLLLKSSDGQLHSDFQACNDYADGLQATANVKCPTLLMAGSDDRMTPPSAVENVGHSIKDSQITIIPRTGHMMMVEEPDLTLQALWKFVSSHIRADRI
jgi:pimeloyl-ACP methyl ester carboxylesterase